MNPFDMFHIIYCINLDKRTDRWEDCLKEFEKVGILDRVIRFPAIEDVSPAHGNHLSHAKCLKMTKEGRKENCLIFEDDVNFFDGAIDTLSKVKEELPFDWEMLYLGANVYTQAKQISTHLARLSHAFATHAYAINHTLFDRLIELNNNPATAHNDVAYSELIIPERKCYVVYPLVAGQRLSYSDIMHHDMDSNEMFKERIEKNMVKL